MKKDNTDKTEFHLLEKNQLLRFQMKSKPKLVFQWSL